MSAARTYFFNKINNDDLARLFGNRENFFLENVDSLDRTVTRIQAMLSEEGLSSVVVHAPINPPPSPGDLLATIPIVGVIWAALQGAGSIARPSGDVTLRLTSQTSLSVAFSRPAPESH